MRLGLLWAAALALAAGGCGVRIGPGGTAEKPGVMIRE